MLRRGVGAPAPFGRLQARLHHMGTWRMGPWLLGRPRLSTDGAFEALAPDTLVDRYGERMYRLAYRITRNNADAEDVTQNALLKVLRKRHTFRGEADPMGWIYRIVLNEAREIFRKRKRRPAVSLDALPIEFDENSHPVGISDFSGRPDRDVIAEELREAMLEAVEELPDGYREAVILMDLEGLSYKDAAEVMELTLGAFKTRLHRARLHLRGRLQHLLEEGARPKGEGGSS